MWEPRPPNRDQVARPHHTLVKRSASEIIFGCQRAQEKGIAWRRFFRGDISPYFQDSKLGGATRPNSRNYIVN